MSYVSPNYRTKKELKQALANGEIVTVYNHGLGNVPTDGPVFLEGPHYPKPHTWYAQGVVRCGVLVSVR